MMKYVLRVRNCTETFTCVITNASDPDSNIVSLYIKLLGRFPFLASWNEFAGKPMKAPLDGYAKRDAYKGHA
jgi:hypothetical protein